MSGRDVWCQAMMSLMSGHDWCQAMMCDVRPWHWHLYFMFGYGDICILCHVCCDSCILCHGHIGIYMYSVSYVEWHIMYSVSYVQGHLYSVLCAAYFVFSILYSVSAAMWGSPLREDNVVYLHYGIETKVISLYEWCLQCMKSKSNNKTSMPPHVCAFSFCETFWW